MIKRLMVESMDKIMLNCEEATFLITKSEIAKISCIKKLQLKMHLAGCSFCRRFKLQSEFINNNLQTLEQMKLNQETDFNKLPKEKKEEIQHIIDKTREK